MTDLISRSKLNDKLEILDIMYGSDFYWTVRKIVDNIPTAEIEELSKIKEITSRALRSQDPINIYKANCLEEIAKTLEIKVEPEDKPNDSDQMTIDDII